MSVEYEWHFDEETGDPTPETGARPPRRRWRTRLLIAAAALLVLSLGVFVAWRLSRASVAETAADVEAAVRLELRALETGDDVLYLSLQDDEDLSWLDSQRSRLASGAPLPAVGPGLVATSIVTVETPSVIGDRAEVGFVRLAGPAGGEQLPFRAVGFYRRLPDGRWVHTTPDPEYAGRPLVWVGPRNDLSGHMVETELFEGLAPDLELVADAFCELLACAADVRFSLALTGTLDAGTQPAWVLPPPHLVGVPQGEAARVVWTQGMKGHLVELMLDAVAGRASGGLIGQALRDRVKEYLGLGQTYQADPALLAEALAEERLPPLSDLWSGTISGGQRSIAEDEAAVLVRYIEQQHGREGLIALLYAVADAPSLDALLLTSLGTDLFAFEQRWLGYLREEITPEASRLTGRA
jgi:hypothetical protein